MVIECIIIATIFQQVAVLGLEEGVSFWILSPIYGPQPIVLGWVHNLYNRLTKGQIEK